MALEMRTPGRSARDRDGETGNGLRKAYEALPDSMSNWLVVVLGVVVIGCGLMLVAAVRLLDFNPLPVSGSSMLLQASFDGAAEPYPASADDGYATSVASGAYELVSTAPEGAAAVRTAGLAASNRGVEVSVSVARPDGAATAAAAGVACLDATGSRGYALLGDGTGNFSLVRLESGALRELTSTGSETAASATAASAPAAADSWTRLALACNGGAGAGGTTALTGSVDGNALLSAEDGGLGTFDTAGLVVASTAPGATVRFDDVLALEAPAA